MTKRFLSIFLLSFLQIPLTSYSHPLIAAYESTMAQFLASAGLTQQDAKIEAGKMADFAFGRGDIETSDSVGCIRPGRTGSCQKLTVGETIINNNSDGKLDFISKTDKSVSQLKSMAQLSKYSEQDILKSLYKDSELGDLVFEETYNRDDFIEELMNYTSFDDSNDYAVAPYWYASTGMYLYRTKLPINSDNEYLYFNDFPSLYNRYWEHLENIEPYSEEKEAFLDLTDTYRAQIYQSYYLPVSLKANDVRTKADYFQSVSMPTTALLPINHYIFDIPKNAIADLIAKAKELVRDEDLSLDDAYAATFEYGGTERYKRIEEINAPVDIVKSRRDLSNKSDLAKEELKENVKLVHSSNSLTEEKKEEYTVKEQDLLNSFDNMKNAYFSAQGTAIKTSNGSTVNIDTNENLKSIDFSNVKSDGQGASLSSFVDKTPSINAYDEYRKNTPLPKLNTADDVDKENKPSPPVGVGDGSSNGGVNSGVGGTTNIGNDGKLNSGANSGVGAGAGSGTSAGTISTPVETTDVTEEAGEAYKEPDLPMVTGQEILQPLIDLREKLLEKLNFNIPSGSCQAINIDFFGNAVSSDAHCQLAETIAPLISALMLLIYNILAFRIILSS